jgi:hypothetical protein
MLQIIDDVTNAQGITTFEFNDGTTLNARQLHHILGAPFVAIDKVTAMQCNLVMGWSGCAMHRDAEQRKS